MQKMVLNKFEDWINHGLELVLIVTLSLCPLSSYAQTVGTIVNQSESLNGYTFFSPFSGTKAYLVNNCGELINTWDRGTAPGLSAYFLENGLMLRTYKASPVLGPFTSASNAGGLELVDWDNNTVWSYEINTSTQISHHDAVYMPSGNILVLTWELVLTDEIIELGRDPNEIAPQGYMWSERILELKPIGNDDAEIVWEWNIKDHYIQDFDSDQLNYGVVADHPELFNINLPELDSDNSNASRDWNHFNAIDYHPELDQILISVRNSDEIWILDHSTTTAEATTHTGGQSGRGGDIIYRWGNASAYNRATLSEQKLFGQHGVHWIRDGLEDAHKILIFNNGNGRPGTDYSTAEIIDPPKDENGHYVIPATEPIHPDAAEIVYGDKNGESFYSRYLSNAQRLENGNTLINPGSTGEIFEIDPDRNVVWKYVIPLWGDLPASQGQNSINGNAAFRAYRYAEDYVGFEGYDVTAGPTIESGTDPEDCALFLTEADHHLFDHDFKLIYNTQDRFLIIENINQYNGILHLTNFSGQQILTEEIGNRIQHVDVPPLPNGIYFVRFIMDDSRRGIKKIFIFND